jgi:hypothetical protein
MKRRSYVEVIFGLTASFKPGPPVVFVATFFMKTLSSFFQIFVILFLHTCSFAFCTRVRNGFETFSKLIFKREEICADIEAKIIDIKSHLEATQGSRP